MAFHLCDINLPNQSEDNYRSNRIKDDGSIKSFYGNLTEKAWPTNNFNDPSLRDEKVLVGDIGNTNGSQAQKGRQVSHLKIMGIESVFNKKRKGSNRKINQISFFNLLESEINSVIPKSN